MSDEPNFTQQLLLDDLRDHILSACNDVEERTSSPEDAAEDAMGPVEEAFAWCEGVKPTEGYNCLVWQPRPGNDYRVLVAFMNNAENWEADKNEEDEFPFEGTKWIYCPFGTRRSMPKRKVRVLVALGPEGLENVITDADDLDIEVIVADFADDDELANDWEGLKVVAGEDGDTPRYAQVETMGASHDADSITAIETAPEYEPGDNNDDDDADPDEDEEGGHD